MAETRLCCRPRSVRGPIAGDAWVLPAEQFPQGGIWPFIALTTKNPDRARQRGQMPRGHGRSQKPSVQKGEVKEYVDISSRVDAEAAVSARPLGGALERALAALLGLKQAHYSVVVAPCRGRFQGNRDPCGTCPRCLIARTARGHHRLCQAIGRLAQTCRPPVDAKADPARGHWQACTFTPAASEQTVKTPWRPRRPIGH